MDDLSVLFSCHEKVARWKAEFENASARLELSKINECCATLISQHEPIAKLGIDRERLRLVLSYIRHGDLKRLDRDFEDILKNEVQERHLNGN